MNLIHNIYLSLFIFIYNKNIFTNSNSSLLRGFGVLGFWGFGVSSVFPVVYILAAKTTSMAPSAALSAVSSVGFVGFLVGPPMIGFVAQQTGLRLALGIVSFLGLFIWLLTFKIKK